MSWGLKYTGYAPRVRKDQVMSAIEGCEDMLAFYTHRMIAICATRCDHVVDGDANIPWYEHVSQVVPDIIDEIVHEAGQLAILKQVMMSHEVEED